MPLDTESRNLAHLSFPYEEWVKLAHRKNIADELFRRLEELPSGTEITLSRIYDATRGRDFVQIMMREKADI